MNIATMSANTAVMRFFVIMIAKNVKMICTIIITEFAPIIVVNISWTITNVDIPTSIVLR